MGKHRIPAAAPRSGARRRFAEWTLFLAAVLAAYFPALTGGLLWDDPGHITRPELRPLNGLWRIWVELGATQQYYPVLHSAFWFEHRLWGSSLIGYHLVNVGLHATAAFLLVLIVGRLAPHSSSLAPLFAGLIFAVHPVSVESVAWISEQKNTLSAVFYFASALAYLHFDEHRRRSAYYVAFALFALALLSKTVTATLPAALLVVLWWRRGHLSWKHDVVPLVPWLAIGAVAGLFTAWFEREVIGARGADFSLTLLERVLLAGRIIWFYLGRLVWPANLTFIYPRWNIDAASWPQYVFPLAAIALLWGLWALSRRARGPLAAFLVFAGTLFPVLGFFDVYPFRFSYVADHFQYLASAAIFVLFASGVTAAGAHVRSNRRSIALVCATLVAVLGALTWRQSAMYRDAETLYRETIRRNPESWMAYMNLGTELTSDPNRLREAIAAYEGALRIRPDYPEAQRNVDLARGLLADISAAEHLNLGSTLAETPGRLSDAIAQYEAALRIKPDYFRAHYNLGTVLMDVPGRERDAIQHLERALEIQPDSAEAHLNLGVALSDVPNRSQEAIHHLETAIEKRPDLAHVTELIDRLRVNR